MNHVNVVAILALFVTKKATTGQGSPSHCVCHYANNTYFSNHCDTRGCSVGTNVHCNNGDFDVLFIFCSSFFYMSFNNTSFGCNCPNSPSNATHNGVYFNLTAGSEYYYNYDTCTGFAGNAHDDRGDVSAGANNATDCCNFCCDRNDPYPTNTTTTTATTPITTTSATTTTTTASITPATTTTSPTITTTSVGRKIVSDKWFYLSGLTILVLVTLG